MLLKEYLTNWTGFSPESLNDRSTMIESSAIYVKDVFINPFQVHVEIHDSPVEIHGNDLLFGFPLCEEPLLRDRVSGVQDVLSTARGRLACVTVTDRYVSVATDIVGSYRLYFCQIGQDIYISDTYRPLLERMKKDSPLALDRHEHQYWQRHGYTTGGSTLVPGLHKVPPASILEISAAGVAIRSYFADDANDPDPVAHCQAFESELQQTIYLLSRTERKAVLCFSGGADSTLLAVMMKEQGVDYDLVFFRPVPSIAVNESDLIRAKIVADQLGKELVEIEVLLTPKVERYRPVVRQMLFDRHFAVLHFEALRKVRDIYGTGILVVNGQGSDSILSFGPSMPNKGDLAARLLLNKPFGWLARMAALSVRLKFGQPCRIPGNRDEFRAAFFDQKGYFTVIEPELSRGYRKFIHEIITDLASRFEHEASLLMYLKVYGFIQGSDLQVVIRSACAAGLKSTVLPFATPGVIQSTIRLRDSSKDVFHPKYAIQRALENRGYSAPTTRSTAPRSEANWFDRLSKGLDRLYAEEVEALFAAQA